MLSDNVYGAEENEPFDLVLLLAQGTAAGAFLGFMMPVANMLSNPENGYNFIYQVLLPLFLAGGMVFGALEGLLLWGCMQGTGSRLNVLVRAGIGIAGLVILMVAFGFYAEPSPYKPRPSATDYLLTYGSYAVYGLLFGLLTGSKFQPLRALLSGTTDYQYRVLSAVTGFALRVFAIFGLTESVLYLIWTQQRNLDNAWWTGGVWWLVRKRSI